MNYRASQTEVDQETGLTWKSYDTGRQDQYYAYIEFQGLWNDDGHMVGSRILMYPADDPCEPRIFRADNVDHQWRSNPDTIGE